MQEALRVAQDGTPTGLGGGLGDTTGEGDDGLGLEVGVPPAVGLDRATGLV